MCASVCVRARLPQANVRADVTSGSVVVHVLGPGSLEMSYCITASVTSVNFSLRVFGVPLAGSPFTIRVCVLLQVRVYVRACLV